MNNIHYMNKDMKNKIKTVYNIEIETVNCSNCSVVVCLIYFCIKMEKDVMSLSHWCFHGGWSRGAACSTRALIKHAGVMVQWLITA